MTKSHAAAPTSEKPTFAQLGELMRQIDNGKITKSGLQGFLRVPGQMEHVPADTLMLSFVQQWKIWQRAFPGKENHLAIRLIRFLHGAPPLTVKRPNHDKWKIFQQYIFWHACKGIRFVGEQEIQGDLSVKRQYSDSIENVINSGLDKDQGDGPELEAWEEKGSKKQLDPASESRQCEGIRHSFDILLPQNPWDNDVLDPMCAWYIDESMRGPHKWCIDVEYLLDNALNFTFRLVGRSLSRNEHVEAAYGLLEMWGSGNYPIGFDKDDRLIVLCA